MAVSLLCAGIRNCGTIDYFLIAFPVFELAHVFYVFFKVRYRPTVRAEKVGPSGTV